MHIYTPESRPFLGCKEMADVESLFEFVHMEIVAYFLNKPGKNVDVSIILISNCSILI